MGFFKNAEGDLSSGRLMKLLSFIIAVVLAFLKYDYLVIGIFAGIAVGSEIVQKATGK